LTAVSILTLFQAQTGDYVDQKLFTSYHWNPEYTHTCTHTHIQVYIRLQGSRKPHLATSHNLTTPLSYTNLPHNYTNVRIHAHTTPTHTSPTPSCTLAMERGFS